MLTINKAKNKFTSQPHNKSETKIGISVVSSNCKNQRVRCVNQQNANKGKGQNRKHLRSLSAERVRQKQLKLQKKLKGGDNEELRQGLKENLSDLQMQYDRLKLKRSLITQRQSEKSVGRARLSDIDVQYVQSETKIHQLHNSSHLLSKCVPKSKINLLTQKYKTISAENNCPPSKSSQLEQSKQNISRFQNTQHSCQERQNSIKSLSNFQMPNLNESICSSSLSNLQVIPIGLKVSLAKNSKGIEEDGHSNKRNYLGSSFHRKKGINVLSSKKLNRSSLDNSVVSLELMKQVERRKSGVLTQAILAQAPQQFFTSYCKI